MHADIISARLLVRLAGFTLAGMCLPRLTVAIAVFIRSRVQSPLGFGMGKNFADLHVYWLGIDVQALFRWLHLLGVPATMVVIGALLFMRGSRLLERKLSHVFRNA